MEQIYYGVAVFVYSLFIVRFILSWVGGDFELDADADLDISDVASFKGLTHFLMGSSGWLSIKSLITHNVMWYDYLIAFALGVIFVIILYYVYKLLMKLETKPEVLSGKGLIGKKAEIYLALTTTDSDNLNKYLILVDNGVGRIEIPAKCKDIHTVGEPVVISDYEDGYYILNN